MIPATVHSKSLIQVVLLLGLLLGSMRGFGKEEASTKQAGGRIYLGWGYNKDYFSRSDIYFKDAGAGNYDFVLRQVRAKDRPGFDLILKSLTIPQYVMRAGYYFPGDKEIGIELSFDHTKYVMRDSQEVFLSGRIKNNWFNQDTMVRSADFVHFEHTNGANYLMLNFLKSGVIVSDRKQRHRLLAVSKSGMGIVIPKTDVRLWGERLDNRFHVAGYLIGFEGGLRYEFFRYGYLEGTAKVCYANYSNVLTIGSGKARHHFFSFELIGSAGLSVPLARKRKW